MDKPIEGLQEPTLAPDREKTIGITALELKEILEVLGPDYPEKDSQKILDIVTWYRDRGLPVPATEIAKMLKEGFLSLDEIKDFFCQENPIVNYEDDIISGLGLQCSPELKAQISTIVTMYSQLSLKPVVSEIIKELSADPNNAVKIIKFLEGLSNEKWKV